MSTHEFEIEIKHHQGYTIEIGLSSVWHDSGEWSRSGNMYDVQSVWIFRNGVPLRNKYADRVIEYLGDVVDKYIDLAIEKAEE